MKKELAALESNTSQQRELIEQEIKQLERQLQFAGEKIKSGVLEPNRDLPLRREILRLKRELVALDGPEAEPAKP